MSKKETAVAVKNVEQKIEVPALLAGDWGAGEADTSKDLLINKIYHQQALSKFVEAGTAAAGDWCDMLSGEVLAKKDEVLKLIIFSSYKRLMISERPISSDKFEFKASEEVTPENALLPWEEEVNGRIVRRSMQYNYFCLLADRPNDLPYVLSLQGTKTKAAKKLNTFFMKLRQVLKVPTATFIFNLQSVKESGDKGSWYGVEVMQGERANDDQLCAAFEWYNRVKASNVIVNEEHDREEVVVTE